MAENPAFGVWTKNPDGTKKVTGVGELLKKAAVHTKDPVMDDRKTKALEQQAAFGKNVNPDARPESKTSLLLNPNSPNRNEKAITPFADAKKESTLGTFNGKQVVAGPNKSLSLDGQSVKNPMFIRSEAAKGLVPQAGAASAIPGMQQNPAVTTPGGNMTGLMNQETAMLSSAMGSNMKPGQFQDFSKSIGMNPNTPGGDGAFRNIESQISMLNNQNSQLMGGYGQSVEMGNMSQTKRLAMVQANNEQIKGLSDSLTGRSTLANDLVKALLTAQTGKETTAMTANAGTEQERIKAGATLGAADMAAGGRVQSAAVAGNAEANDAAQTRAMKADELRFKHLSDMKKQGSLSPEEETEFGFLTKKLQRVGAAIEPGEDDLEDAP